MPWLCTVLTLFAATTFAQDTANLLQNGGFEILDAGKPASWRLAGRGAVVQDPARAHTGEAYARVRFDDRASQRVACDPYTRYRVTGWCRAENPQTGELPRIKVYFIDASGKEIMVGGGTLPHQTDQWQHFTVPLRSPAGTALVSIDLIGAFGGSDWFHFDDISLTRDDSQEAAEWGATPDLNGRTVMVVDRADVRSFALYRIPPDSVSPIDGLLTTAAWTGRAAEIRRRPPVCDLDVTFGRPARVSWALIHCLSPGADGALGRAELYALPTGLRDPANKLADIAPEEALVYSVSFSPVTARGLRLRVLDADKRTARIHEFQAFGVEEGLPEGLSWQPLGAGALTGTEATVQQALLGGPAGQTALATGREGGEAFELRAGREMCLTVGPPVPMEIGVRGLALSLDVASLGTHDVLEIALHEPAELDVDPRWVEAQAGGTVSKDPLELAGRRFCELFRVGTRLSGAPLRVCFEIPACVLPAGERLWLTVRSARGLRINPAGCQAALLTCTPAEALREYVPRLERQLMRCYGRCTEAHVYDSRPYKDMALYQMTQRLLRLDPDNTAARLILNRVTRRWWPVELSRPGPADAPDWAVWGRRALAEWKGIADWWLRNRWIPNGEIGGNLNDDVEYTCHWPLLYLTTGDDRYRIAQRMIADAVWEQSGGNGYSIRATDVEHAAEDSSCSLPQMLLCEYGDPLHVERMMAMSRHVPFWTGINELGQRHFRSYIFNDRMVDDKPPHDIDHLYCALAMCGATHLAWYGRFPEVHRWVQEYAHAWAQAAMSTEKGKPLGALPCDIHFRTGKIAPYTDAWNKSVYYSFGQYVMEYLLIGAARLGDDPLIAEAAELQYGSSEKAVQRAKEALARFARPPQPDPEHPESLDGTWKGMGDERSLARATLATGDKQYVTAGLRETCAEMERWRWLLTEAEPYTDRIPVPGTTLLRYVFLGGDVAGKTNVPGLAVSYEGGGTNFGALVMQAERDRLKVLLYSFVDAPLPLCVRVWRLEHGRYRVTAGIDGNRDDVAEALAEDRVMELYRHAPIPLSLMPGKVTVLEVTPVERLEPLEDRPDLAIGPADVHAAADRSIEVTVHNIGPRPAPATVVRLVDDTGTVQAETALPPLEAPLDLKPRAARVTLRPTLSARHGWRVTVDEDGRVGEICEENNAQVLGPAVPQFWSPPDP